MNSGPGGQRENDGAATGAGEEPLRGAEDLGILFKLAVCEALEALAVRRRSTGEEVPGDDVVDLTSTREAEGPVEGEAQELSLLMADEGHGSSKG